MDVARWVRCGCCDGHGMTMQFSGIGEPSPRECEECDGKGRVYLYPGGAIATAPGGRFVGRIPAPKPAPDAIQIIKQEHRSALIWLHRSFLAMALLFICYVLVM